MKTDEINTLLETVRRPIYKIEADLGMPKTTLQKAVKGQRTLPKKWATDLKDYVAKKAWIVGNVKDFNKEVESEKEHRDNPLVNAARGRDANGVNNDEVPKETTKPPKNLDELKALCPFKKGTDEYRLWVQTERQKYSI